MKIYLDNILVKYPSESLLKPSITWRKKDDEGFKAFSFTGDLEFVGDEYTYLKNKLWTDSKALENEVELRFEDECCSGLGQIFKFTIQARSIEWCENSCLITADAVERSADQAALQCLRNTMIWDNSQNNLSDGIPFKSRRHPRMTYCNEVRPQWHHDFVMIIAIILWLTSITLYPIVISLIPIVITVNAIINFINSIGGSLNNVTEIDTPQDLFNAFDEYRNKILDYMIGCGKKHPSPLVRMYAANVCGHCGLTFNSSIFADPASDYYNTVYHNAPVDKGVPKDNTTTFWIDKNEPLLDGIGFFDQLKGMFNADWQISGGVLTFERRDYFKNKTPWLDITALSEDEYDICYQWSKKDRPAFGMFEYAKDAINSIGAEANRRWGDIVEWNNPPLISQKGKLTPAIQFAACRFRDDRVRMNDGPERDVLTFYENGVLVPAAISNKIKGFKNVILLNQHLCYTPMLLIWDGVDVNDARVSGSQFGQFSGFADASPGEFYNYPYWFVQGRPGNMYDRFWSIEDPRSTGFQGKIYTATIELKCDRLLNMDLDGMVKTSEGLGRIDSIEINYKGNTMVIKGQI